MVICYLGIGTNLGNRRKNIKSAVKKISTLKNTKIMKESRVFEFAPVGGPPEQRNYLNSALKIHTGLSAKNLIKNLKKIENDLGRVKTVRFGPRVIDLDILFYGDKNIKSQNLTIPHPRLFARNFVIKPLKEVL